MSSADEGVMAVMKGQGNLHWKLAESLGLTLGTTKSVAAVLKSINATYLKTISDNAEITFFTELTADAFEKEVQHQLAEAEKGLKYSCNTAKEEALARIKDSREILRMMGLYAEAKLGLQHMYDPETQRGYSTVMVIEVLPASDGVRKHLAIGHGSIHYEYKGSKLRFKTTDMGEDNDSVNRPTLELAAFASIGEEIKRHKPHQ